MSRRVRLFLLVFGVAALLFGALALSYAYAPVTVAREQTPLAPTLFVQPQ